MRASVTLFRNLQHLGNYCILNYTGFVKICKKHDKSVAAELRLWAPHLEAELETLAFVTQSGLGTLLRQLEAAHANPNPNPNPHPNPNHNPNPNPNPNPNSNPNPHLHRPPFTRCARSLRGLGLSAPCPYPNPNPNPGPNPNPKVRAELQTIED